MGEDKQQTWLAGFLARGVEGPEWAAGAAEAVRKFSRLDAEEQAQVADKLAAAGSEPSALAAMEKLYASGETGLPARVRLAAGLRQAGRDIAEETISSLRKWEALAEDSAGVADAAGFFQLPLADRTAAALHLARWLRADLLGELIAAAPDKAAMKPLKKALHQLRSAGVIVEPATGETRTVGLGPEKEEVDEAYLTPPDAGGTMLIYLYHTVSGTPTLAVMVVNDRAGIIKLDSFEVPRPRLVKILEATKRNPHAVLAKSDPHFTRRLVQAAEAAGLKHGAAQDRNYLAGRRRLGIVDEPAGAHPLWSLLSEPELREERGLIYRSPELLQHRLFEDWTLLPLDEGRFLAELTNLKTSPLALTPVQEREREDQFLAKEAGALLASEGRELWRDRLLVCAYLLSLLGDDEPARITAATALALEKADDPAPPLFLEMMRKTVTGLSAEEEKPPGPPMDRGGLVMA